MYTFLVIFDTLDDISVYVDSELLLILKPSFSKSCSSAQLF